jgi:hypothetical protein
MAAVKARGLGSREVIVRVNGLDTTWWVDDVNAAVRAHPDGILVPKISTAGHLNNLAQHLFDLAADHKIRLWAMIETPPAIKNAREIAAVARDFETRLAGFVIGTNDLALETRAHAKGNTHVTEDDIRRQWAGDSADDQDEPEQQRPPGNTRIRAAIDRIRARSLPQPADGNGAGVEPSRGALNCYTSGQN